MLLIIMLYKYLLVTCASVIETNVVWLVANHYITSCYIIAAAYNSYLAVAFETCCVQNQVQFRCQSAVDNGGKHFALCPLPRGALELLTGAARMRTRGIRRDYTSSTRSWGCYRTGARIMNHGASEITKDLHLAP